MTACPTAAQAAVGADDRDRATLVEPQQLRERELQPRGDLRGDSQGRAGLAALDLREHRSRDATALRKIAEREAHALAEGLDALSYLDHEPYVITYGCMSGGGGASGPATP